MGKRSNERERETVGLYFICRNFVFVIDCLLQLPSTTLTLMDGGIFFTVEKHDLYGNRGWVGGRRYFNNMMEK